MRFTNDWGRNEPPASSLDSEFTSTSSPNSYLLISYLLSPISLTVHCSLFTVHFFQRLIPSLAPPEEFLAQQMVHGRLGIVVGRGVENRYGPALAYARNEWQSVQSWGTAAPVASTSSWLCSGTAAIVAWSR